MLLNELLIINKMNLQANKKFFNICKFFKYNFKGRNPIFCEFYEYIMKYFLLWAIMFLYSMEQLILIWSYIWKYTERGPTECWQLCVL